MLVSELLDLLTKDAPLESAEPWDNVGLLTGNNNDEVTNILITLDFSNDLIDVCKEENFNVIIAHHPLYFLDEENNPTGMYLDAMEKLKVNKINFIALHTNFDKKENNMSRKIAQLLQLENIKPAFDGFGVICQTTQELRTIAKNAKKEFDLDFISASVNIDDIKPTNIAVVSGSGKSFMEDALKADCNVMITGDVTHHSYVDALEYDFCFIDIKHKAEEVFIDLVAELLEEANIKYFVSYSNDLNVKI